MTDNEALEPITDAARAAQRRPGRQIEHAMRAGLRAEAAAIHRAPRSPESCDELIARLGRRFRGATLKLEFELRTAIARQIFQRDFVYISRQLHALEASRRVQGIDRQILKGALAAVAQRGDAVRTLLLLYASDARALIAMHGHAGADVEFERPAQLQATIVSPHARDFLDILGQADDALTQVEKAWLLGLLEPAEKARQASECRRALHGFKEIVRQQRHVVGLHVREVNEARRRLRPGNAADSPAASGPTRPCIDTSAAADAAGAAPASAGQGSRTSQATLADRAAADRQPDAGLLVPVTDEPPADAMARPVAAIPDDDPAHA